MTQEKVLNLTIKTATPEQKVHGVYDLPSIEHEDIKRSLEFKHLPSKKTIKSSVNTLVITAMLERLKNSTNKVLVDAEPYLISHLTKELQKEDFEVLYSFKSKDKHVGFVKA